MSEAVGHASGFDAVAAAAELEGAAPREVLRAALEQFDNVVLSFSGAEDVVLVDMLANMTDRVRIICLDTGRLHAETLRFLENVRSHYGRTIEVISPDAEGVQRLVSEKGLFSFYEDGHGECCSIRKIEPLQRQLEGADAWITGQRRDQSPTRADVPPVQLDRTFSSPGASLIKFTPLADWRSADVWRYIHDHGVPYNELHDRGFVSIGCEPCTRAVAPHEHERAGRWWWEADVKKECGLHLDNLDKPERLIARERTSA